MLGGVTITTSNLNLTKGGRVGADTFGQGNAGVVNITATGDLTFDGETSGGFSSGVSSQVTSDAAGNSGGVTISTTNFNLTNGEDSGGFPSGVTSVVNPGAVGNAGGVKITTTNLNLTKGGVADASTFGQGDAGAVNITTTKDITFDGETSKGDQSGVTSNGAVGDAGLIDINATESVTLDENSGILNAVAQSAVGNGGALNITTPNLALTNSSLISASTLGEGDGGDISINATDVVLANFSFIDASNLGTASGGSVFVKADNLSLDNGIISAINTPVESPTENAALQVGGNITLEIAENLSLWNNSNITTFAGGNVNGGNVDINANFIVAFPDGDNNITAFSLQGRGGNIRIATEGIFGIEERPLNFFTNDINASSQVSGLDGTVSIITPDINPVQGARELPTNVVEPEQTTEQACQANREAAAKNGLVINGKGGIPAPPDQPLTSQNLTINGEITSASPIPEPIKTSQGKIQLARGIKITEDGQVILTAYRTNNAGERLPAGRINCGQI